MDYWISSNNVQMGPYSMEQLQQMWQQGQLSSTTYYFDDKSSAWLPLRALIESVRALFTVEEAFVRLGQNRQKGCLTVYNKDEKVQLFVEGGFVICALGDRANGEFALARALHLEGSAYEWFYDYQPVERNVRVNIAEYALKHSIARDVRVANAPIPAFRSKQTMTVSLSKPAGEKVEVKLKPKYLLVTEDTPAQKFPLAKMNNLVGREDACDLVLDSLQVSRKHCLLEVWEENVKVKDLDSSNGTFINGTPVRDGFLRVGDELGLGSFKLILQKEQKKAPALT